MPGPLRLSPQGMDERALNLFRLFFRGPCQNQAVIVEHDKEVDAFLIDLDTQQGARLLAQQREQHPERIFVVLSLRDQEETANTVFVKKPTEARAMTVAIQRVRALANSLPNRTTGWPARATQTTDGEQPETAEFCPSYFNYLLPGIDPSVADSANTGAPAKDLRIIAANGLNSPDLHTVAMLLDEQGHKSFLGHRDDIDPANAAALLDLLYNPRDFLQGHIQSAVKIAFARKAAMRMVTPWKSITILPVQKQVHLIADEAQLRAACGIPFKTIVGLDGNVFAEHIIQFRPLGEKELDETLKSKHLARLDAFLWKVALYTSKGRLPSAVDPRQRLFLKRWPGMTRLLLPPHALRIAALLVRQPQTLFEAAETMGIRQQYIAAFVSAAHALGLIRQKTQIEARSTAGPSLPPPVGHPPGVEDGMASIRRQPGQQ